MVTTIFIIELCKSVLIIARVCIFWLFEYYDIYATYSFIVINYNEY